MADYIVKDTELTSVANAIRTAGGTSSLLTFPNGFTSAINNISGDSSDFSTATVTVINNYTATFKWCLPNAVADAEEGYYSSQGDAYIETGTNTFDVILFKGYSSLYAPVEVRTISISGDIEEDGHPYYIITGDCTITIS